MSYRPSSLSRFGLLLLLGAAGGLHAQATVGAAARGSVDSASVPMSSTAPAARPEALSCRAPTGSHIVPPRDAQGRCPDEATRDPRVRTFDRDQLESTGYTGDLGSALQTLDPSLQRR